MSTLVFFLVLFFIVLPCALIMGNKYWNGLSPERQKELAVPLRWINALMVLALLSMCMDWTDIRVLEKKMAQGEDKASLRISVGPGLTDKEITAWVSKKCRDVMVLPPIEPVPIQAWKREAGRGRTEYLFRCIRP